MPLTSHLSPLTSHLSPLTSRLPFTAYHPSEVSFRAMAKKSAIVYACTECGSQSPKWLGRCPDCNAWNSFAEENPPAASSAQPPTGLTSTEPVPLDSVDFEETPRIGTGLDALDRVLGGGMVEGGVVLVGGEPGIGKSTLLLQAADQARVDGPVLYVSGEESPRQIALRARRLGIRSERIRLFAETSVERIVAEIVRLSPALVIIDSIQTVHTSRSPSSPGSVGQVRDCAGLLLGQAKTRSIPLFLIGHVTKEGSIAGPRTLEHIVDTVLYFEGDRLRQYRLIRAVKNRFGPVNEVALYQMHDDGLEEVPEPSALMLAERSESAGSAIVSTVEGTRPLLVEIQALVSSTHFPTPKRMAMGLDANRLSLLLAVLEKRSGENFLSHDVYVNVAGGLELDEPALDLGIIAALVSSQTGKKIPADMVIFGEVGLLGEIRGVSQPELRIREAMALGFRHLVIPYSNAETVHAGKAKVTPVRTVEEFVRLLRS